MSPLCAVQDRTLGGAGLAFNQTPLCTGPVLSQVGKTTATQHDPSKGKHLTELCSCNLSHFWEAPPSRQARRGWDGKGGTMTGQIDQFSYLISTRTRFGSETVQINDFNLQKRDAWIISALQSISVRYHKRWSLCLSSQLSLSIHATFLLCLRNF